MRANKFVHILSNSNHDGVTRGQLFRLLGLSICKQSPPEDQHLSVLNGAWKAITTLTQPSEFIQCIEPWAEFASSNFGVCFIFILSSFHMNVIKQKQKKNNYKMFYNSTKSVGEGD